MSDAKKAPHIAAEAEYCQNLNRKFLSRLEKRGVSNPLDSYLSGAARSHANLVRSLDRASFKLPTNVPKFVGDAASVVLQEMLYENWELNEQFVGERLIDAFVQINGTPEQIDLIERGLSWARDYVERRLARPNGRDRGCPYRKFYRLWLELSPWLDDLGSANDTQSEVEHYSVVGQYIGVMCDYIAWALFESTWIADVRWSPGGRVRLSNPTGVDIETLIMSQGLFGVYRWKHARVFDELLVDMAEVLAASGETHSSDAEELERIELLADDIAQMRPFLVRNFRPSRAGISLPGDLVAFFGWDTNNRIGVLRCGETERELLDQQERGVADRSLAITFHGLLANEVNPWQTVATHDGALPFPPLAVGRVVLEALHAKLFSFFDQIDIEAILARWNQAERTEPASTDEETAVIAACITTGGSAVVPDRRKGRVTSSLRLSALRSVLEGHLGCTSRSGKGSELVFYRVGGRQAFVSRHKANPQVPAIAIQKILKKLGIGLEDWIAATRR